MSRVSARRPTGFSSIDVTSCRAREAPTAIRPAPSAARVSSWTSTLRGSLDRAVPAGLGNVPCPASRALPASLRLDARAARVVSDDPLSGIPVRSSSHSAARSLAAPSFNPFSKQTRPRFHLRLGPVYHAEPLRESRGIKGRQCCRAAESRSELPGSVADGPETG